MVSLANRPGRKMETFSNLRQMIVLAETGNFRSAAARLGISHSALSQSLSKLEEFYGVALFDRDRYGTVPNAFGRKVLGAARSVLAEISQVEREIHLMRNLEEGQLVIGASPAVFEGIIGRTLTDYSNRFPKLRFIVRPLSMELYEEELREHRIDVYIGMTPRQDRPGLKYEALHTVPPVIVCRKKHPILNLPGPVLEHIHEFPIVGPEAADGVLESVWGSLVDENNSFTIPGAPFLKTSNLGLVRQLILGSDAIAIQSEWSVAADIANGKMVAIAHPLKRTNPGAIVTLDGHPLSPIAREFIRETSAALLSASATSD